MQAIDFRRGIDGVFAVCKNIFLLDPYSGAYFIFSNSRCSAVKILAYDSQGFWLCHKRLSKGTFRNWPTAEHSLLTLSSLQLQVLLQNGNPAVITQESPWRPLKNE